MLRTAAKTLLKLCFVTAIVGGGTGGIWYYGHRQSAAYRIQQLESQRKQLEEEKQQLQTVVKRLSDERARRGGARDGSANGRWRAANDAPFC